MAWLSLPLITGIIVILTLVGAFYLLEAHPSHFVLEIIREFRQLANFEWSPGAINALGLIAVFILGVFLVLENGFGHLLSWLVLFFGLPKAVEYRESVSVSTVFFVIVGYAALSVFLTMLADRSRR